MSPVWTKYYAAHPEADSTRRKRIASVKHGPSLINIAVFHKQ